MRSDTPPVDGHPQNASGGPHIDEPINILIVDDEPKNLTVLETVLDDPGYRVIRAESADDALLALVAEEFALLILDIRMPGMTGFELAQTIKSRKKTAQVPIIFLTAYYNEDQHVLEGYDTGAVDYLLKPVSGAILRSKVAVFAELHRRQRESTAANRALQTEVAERRHAQEELAEKTEQLKHQTVRLRNLAIELTRVEARERKRLAALLHDDLQQVLIAAKMGLRELREKTPGNGGSKALDHADAMVEEAIRTSRDMTRELRPPALYEGGLGPALQWLASKSEQFYRLRVSVAGTQLGCSIGEDLKALMFECARELFLNTAKHAEAHNVRLELREEDSTLHLAFEDDGKGFDAESADKEGSAEGLGLFSIRERLASLGGSMRISSAEGKGTKVELQVPMEIPARPEVGDHPIQARNGESNEVEHAEQTNEGRKSRVLVADDHPIVREGIVNLLNGDERLNVIGQVADGIEALEAIERSRPDVVLLDVNMPRMNGIEAAREIHRRWPEVGIIGLSVQDDEATAKAMTDAGASVFIPKLGEPSQMISAILTTTRRK